MLENLLTEQKAAMTMPRHDAGKARINGAASRSRPRLGRLGHDWFELLK
ncbi:MAG: hypothetical protein V1792_21700 [Pseudomonadota bacterium]